MSHGKHYPALLEYDTCYLVKLYTINKWGEQNPRWIIATILQNWHFYCVLNVQGFSLWQWSELMHIYTWGKLRPALQFVIMIYRAIPIEETFAIWRFVGSGYIFSLMVYPPPRFRKSMVDRMRFHPLSCSPSCIFRQFLKKSENGSMQFFFFLVVRRRYEKRIKLIVYSNRTNFFVFFLFNWEKKRTTLWFYLATLIPVVYVRFCSKVDYINNKTIYKFIVHTLFQTRDFNLHEFSIIMHACSNTDFHFINSQWNKIQQQLSGQFK